MQLLHGGNRGRGAEGGGGAGGGKGDTGGEGVPGGLCSACWAPSGACCLGCRCRLHRPIPLSWVRAVLPLC